MMPIEDRCSFGSRRVYVFVLLAQTISITSSNIQPHLAIMNGATGYIICYVFAYIFFGIPILYMELIVSQFTERDCLEVWKARACLSHIGYILVFWQVTVLIYNHIIVSFTVHYLLISFENPVPYHICGRWTTKDCMILTYNYSVNQDCIKVKDSPSYCDNVYTTFPEYQYWRYYVLGSDINSFFVAWRVCLASGLVCIIVFLNCFKRMRSLKWFLGVFVIFPFFGYTLLMMGSMTQKGLVVKYEEALDSTFTLFVEKFKISGIIQQVIYGLNVGSGVMFNLSANTSFRSPCYANTVITVVVSAAFTTLAVCTTAMMSCPYAYEYDINTSSIMDAKMSLMFEKIPRLLFQYKCKTFWLLLYYSAQFCLGVSTDVVLFYSLTEMIAKRYEKIARYPGLVSLFGTVFLFLFTLPLFGPLGINILVGAFRKYIILASTFIGMIECLVFIVWYGFDRFSEDVHFMQGIRPKNYMRLSWLFSSIVMAFVFISEFHSQIISGQIDTVDAVGLYTLSAILALIILLLVGKLLLAACRHRVKDVIRLDPTWGPKNEVLMRSRAMFTAQAMTKEYMYRQYHLQAGILARQRNSNSRVQKEAYERFTAYS